MLERVHKELNRRTRVAGLFPNEASLLRLVSGSDGAERRMGNWQKVSQYGNGE
jgi:transposase-like protein